MHTSKIWRWHNCFFLSRGWRAPLRRQHGPAQPRCRGQTHQCGVAGRCPHLDEVVTQVFDVFTHVGHACTLFKIVLILHFARISELPENSQRQENVHRPDDGMLRGLLGARKSEVHPEPLHLRPFQSSGLETQATLKTVCLQHEFALNLSQSLRTQSRRSDTEAASVQETLLWKKRDVQGRSPLSSRAPLVRIQEQTRTADATIQPKGLAPRTSLTKTSRSTTYQRLGSRIRQRLWKHLALTAKSTVICQDLRPAACKECRGAGNKLVTRRTESMKRKRTNRQRGNQERMSYHSTSYTSKPLRTILPFRTYGQPTEGVDIFV